MLFFISGKQDKSFPAYPEKFCEFLFRQEPSDWKKVIKTPQKKFSIIIRVKSTLAATFFEHPRKKQRRKRILNYTLTTLSYDNPRLYDSYVNARASSQVQRPAQSLA